MVRAAAVLSLMFCLGAVAALPQQPSLRLTPLQSMVWEARNAHMPMGIAMGLDRSLCTGTIVPPSPEKAHDPLAYIQSLALPHGYSVLTEEGVIVVRKASLSTVSANELDRMFPTFPSLNGSMKYAGFVLNGWVNAGLHPGRGFGGNDPNGPEDEVVSLHSFTQTRVQQIANAIVSQRGKGVWLAVEWPDNEFQLTTLSYTRDHLATSFLECDER